MTLLGQNVNGYRGLTDDGRLADLAELIRVVAAVDGIERIRYTTSHPLEFSDSLIQAHADVPELVKHLHLPVQSGSDRILSAMKRNHTALEYKSKLRKLRAAVPGICISSDFIVGFPGETEKDFQQTMKLIEDVGFDFSYSFVYSQRPGTPAADLAGRNPGSAEKRALERAAAPPEPTGLRDQPTNGRFDPAHPGHRLLEKRPRRAAGPYREQPNRQLPLRQSNPDRPVCRCAHRCGATALVARVVDTIIVRSGLQDQNVGADLLAVLQPPSERVQHSAN